jgi:FMN phosphatase YigB (HAD superfamily)
MASLPELVGASKGLPRPKALLFDFMGTCLDWKSAICEGLKTVNPNVPIHGEDASTLAMQWRSRYFAAARKRTDKQLAPEDIDITHRRVLDELFEERGIGLDEWNESMRQELVQRWHCQHGAST